jgi:hypothetical protein
VKDSVNPFTRFLSQRSTDGALAAFIEYWDRLERVVVGVYRAQLDEATAAAEYRAVWPWLRQHYPRWQAALRPHWQATRAAGQPTHVDPFALLLDIAAPADIAGDWRAMQHLPAAREAINRYLVENQDDGRG